MENPTNEKDLEQKTINVQVPTANQLAGKRSVITILFALVIVLFFFNFFTVSCGGQKVGSVSGISLVTGTEIKSKDMFSGKEKEGEKVPSNAWAIIAFGAAILGAFTFLIKEKSEALVGTLAGAIGFVSLLILQFAIKNAVEKKFEGSIQADFHFAYWGALIAMGIAGFLSFLRNQKKQSIVARPEPLSSLADQGDEKDENPLSLGDPVQPTHNFDLGNWLSRNKSLVLGILGSAIVLIGIYYLFLRHDPVKDAKKVFSSFCDCSKNYNEAIIKSNEEFIKDFDSYGFKNKQEARNKLQELQKAANDANSDCYNKAQQKYDKFRNLYVADKSLIEKFDFAYNALSESCNPANQNALTDLNGQIENRLASIKDPLPDIEKIKSDLLGKKLMSWSFDALSEFNQASILKVTEGPNIAEFHVKLKLVGLSNPTTDSHDAELLVTYGQSEGGWSMNELKPIYYTQSYLANVNEWTNVNLSSFGDISYSIIDNGQKYWAQDGYYGAKYKGGGSDGEKFSLSSNEISLMSRENGPVTLVFKMTPK